MKLPPFLPLRTIIVAMGFAVQCHAASNLVVTNNADSGPGTLRDSLAQAQSGDTITFDIAGVITNSSSDLIISNDVSIIGPGPDVLTVAGNTNKSPRIFTVAAGTTVSLSGLTLRDSYAGQFSNGGGIFNGGNLSVTNCVFARCKSGIGYLVVTGDPFPGGIAGDNGYHGGAIYSTGMVTVVDCDFFSNSAAAGTDGVDGPAGFGGNGGHGGGIYTTGTLLAMNCNFLTNSAGNGGAGGPGFFSGAAGSPHGSAGGNGGFGGAIYATGAATFVNCAFGYNHAGSGGTAGSGLSGTSAHPTGGNGGHGGRGGDGGTIFSVDQLTVTSCTFYQNYAGAASAGGAGGAGFQAPGGFGGFGGTGGNGMVCCSGSAKVTACTFYQNGAGGGGSGGHGGAGGTGNPGGLGGYGGPGGNGGAIYAGNSTPSITLQNVLATQDGAGGGGGGGAGGANGFGGNAPSNTNGLSGIGPDLFGAYTSLGHNYIRMSAGNSGFTNGIKSDLVNTNFLLAITPLLRNGGRTLTCALQSSTNLVVNSGDDSIVGPPLNITTDQRGYPRLSGLHVDIGASELIWPTLPMVISGSVSNGQFYVTLTNLPNLRPAPVLLRSSSAAGPWLTGPSLVEVTPGVYQGNLNGSLSQLFIRARTP